MEARIELVKNDWMTTDHYGIVVEGRRARIEGGGLVEDRILLPRRWKGKQGERQEDMERAHITELRMRMKVGEDGNGDELARPLVENSGSRKVRKAVKRPMDGGCKELEEEYMLARRTYNRNPSENNKIRLKAAGARKRKGLRSLSRRLFAERRVELEALAQQNL